MIAIRYPRTASAKTFCLVPNAYIFRITFNEAAENLIQHPSPRGLCLTARGQRAAELIRELPVNSV
jgi:hypothetical protein